jgi:hypothetical protein
MHGNLCDCCVLCSEFIRLTEFELVHKNELPMCVRVPIAEDLKNTVCFLLKLKIGLRAVRGQLHLLLLGHCKWFNAYNDLSPSCICALMTYVQYCNI